MMLFVVIVFGVLLFYYVSVLVDFDFENFKTKRQFYLSLIPFYRWIIWFNKRYGQLE